MVGREQTLKTVVMGAGNILLGDDGIGVHVIRALKEQGGLPDGVDLIDAGTATLDALTLVDGVDHLVIIDAVKGGGCPGTVYQFSSDDVVEPAARKISLHQMSLLESLKVSRMIEARIPKISIIGVEPNEVSAGISLSREVADRIPDIITIIMTLLRETHPAA